MMRREKGTPDESKSAAPILHRAARIEDAIHRFRQRRARKRGLKPMVIPYTSYGAPGWTRVLCRVLLAKPAPATIRAENIRGWRSFTSVPVDGQSVIIDINGIETQLTTARGGIVDVVLPSDWAPGWHSITIRTTESQPVIAPIYVVDPAVTFGIISDVDDTVMVTALPRPLLAAWNTFVLSEHARRPVSGMAVLYERLRQAHPGAPVIYLSTGAWNVAPALTRFLSRHLYPAGPLLLTDWGPTHDRWFRSGRDHKKETLLRLSEEFPAIRWLLIGDDGQHDEELYGEFVRTHPDRVAAIAIRQLSPGEAVLAGGRSKGEEHDAGRERWIYAVDGAGLATKLGSAGLLQQK